VHDDERNALGEHHRDADVALARLGLEEADDLARDLVQVRPARDRRASGEENGEQIGDELADALDLLQRELAEARAELLVVDPLGQELDERRTETSGLRISCATPAASVPSADSRSARWSSIGARARGRPRARRSRGCVPAPSASWRASA
jgi:hypothetical protein